MMFKYTPLGEILYPNEGRLHKGNPLKRISKEVSRSSKKISGETSRVAETVGKEVERASGDVTDGEWWTKTGEALLASASDPGSWLAFAVNPTFGMGMGAQNAADAYAEMSEAERAEAEAEAAAANAAEEERVLIEKQKVEEAKQAEMVREREAQAQAESEERITRLGTGRRGLLYQGKETGVTNTVLGG